MHACLVASDVSKSLWPVDCSPPGSSVHGILQARILGWVIMLSSRGSSWPRARSQVSCFLDWHVGSLPFVPPGKPKGYKSFIRRWSVSGEKEKGKELFIFHYPLEITIQHLFEPFCLKKSLFDKCVHSISYSFYPCKVLLYI